MNTNFNIIVSGSSAPLLNQTYGTISQSLHWLMAFLVAGMIGLGWSFDLVHGPLKGTLIDLHKSTGLLVFALFFLRALWRLYTRPTFSHAHESFIQRLMADIVHALLYILLALIPLSGWVMVGAMGRPVSFFGLFDVPSPIEKTKAIVSTLKSMHEFGAFVLFCFISLHTGAALYHHFSLKDDILQRMLPWTKGSHKEKARLSYEDGPEIFCANE